MRIRCYLSARAAAVAGLLTIGLLAAGAPTAGAAPLAAGDAGTARKATGMVSLTFDDGKVTQADNTAATLERNGMRGTYYVIARAMSDWGMSSYLSVDQVKSLAARGHEVGNHSSQHYDLVDVQAGKVDEFEDAQADLSAAQKIFKDQVGVTPRTCAYPFGRSDTAVQAAAGRAGLKACRGTSRGENRAGSLNPYDLKTMYVTRSTTVAEIKAAAKAAKANGSWVVYVWHGVVDDSADLDIDEDILTSTFNAQLAAIKSTGVPVRTVDQALTALGR